MLVEGRVTNTQTPPAETLSQKLLQTPRKIGLSHNMGALKWWCPGVVSLDTAKGGPLLEQPPNDWSPRASSFKRTQGGALASPFFRRVFSFKVNKQKRVLVLPMVTGGPSISTRSPPPLWPQASCLHGSLRRAST